MSTACTTPTYTEVEATYGIFPDDPPPCIPDAVTEVFEILTEALADLLAESGDQLLLEGSD